MTKVLPPFKFKQFVVAHDQCAMKVGVDGVLTGAWATHESPNTILDIGTGSGLIALMLQQRFPTATVFAIEPNSNAFQQAQGNFKTNAANIHLLQESLQNSHFLQKFDLIVTNPPFFKENVASNDLNRDEARQEKFLPLNELLKICTSLLEPDGKLVFIYPTLDCTTVPWYKSLS